MSADAPSWWHAPACSPVDTPPAPLLLLMMMMMMMMTWAGRGAEYVNHRAQPALDLEPLRL